ncbi:hypothetical protein AUJ84_01795 [Candidatus Pacearchaeota archaeon CG1_02_32_132]|nr:MAG: hypothetical protein AUJ84_01795 [Candidatus Pacearchaeota archaeon CG1_02_32_132]
MNKKYLSFSLLTLVIFILFYFIFYQASLTGNIVSKFEFESPSFKLGDTLKGYLIIDTKEDSLPLDSFVIVNFGGKKIKVPIVSLLDNAEIGKAREVDFYPEVQVSLEVFTSEEIIQNKGLIGFVTSTPPPPPPSSSVSSSASNAVTDLGVKTKNSYPIEVSATVSKESVYFESTNILGANIKEAKLLDGSLVNKDFIELNLIDGKIEIVSHYNENVLGYKGDILRIPLTKLGLVVSDRSEITSSLETLRGEILINNRAYIPFSENGRNILGTGNENLVELEKSFDCGNVICTINSCSSNFDSGKILAGEIETSSSNVISCSSSCGTKYTEVSCPKRELVFERAKSESGNEVKVIDSESEKVVANVKVNKDEVNIVFSN